MDERRAIHDLPDDILSRIFQEYANFSDFELQTSYYPGNVSYSARVILCSINSRMRVLAIAMYELWTYIQIGSPPSYPPIPLLELCIARSGAVAPIQVDWYHTPTLINWESHVNTIDESHALNAISLLFPFVHRWKSFKTFFTNGTAQPFADLDLGNAILLEKADISSCCTQETNCKVLANLAKPRELRYLGWSELHADEGDNPSPRPASAISSFQWDHLQHLNLNCRLSCDALLRLLSVLTSVAVLSVSLTVGQSSPSHVNLVSPARICLPELEELTIHANVSLYDALQHIDLPRIKYLQAWLNGSSWNEAPDSIATHRDFIVRISASVEFGSFDFTGFRENDIIELFSHSEIFRMPVADFYIWNHNPRDSETASRAMKSLASRRPDLRRRLEHQEYSDFVNFGWQICGDE